MAQAEADALKEEGGDKKKEKKNKEQPANNSAPATQQKAAPSTLPKETVASKQMSGTSGTSLTSQI